MVIFILICCLIYLYWSIYIFGFDYLNYWPYTDFTQGESQILLEEFHINFVEGMEIEKVYSPYDVYYSIKIKGTVEPEKFLNECIDFDYYDKEAIFDMFVDYDNSKELFVLSMEDKVKSEYNIDQYSSANSAIYEYNNNTKECKLYLSKPRCKSSKSWRIFEYKKDTFSEKTKMIINELKFSIQEKLDKDNK